MACGGSNAPSPANVAGQWKGTIAVVGELLSYSMTLTQDGSTVAGTWLVEGGIAGGVAGSTTTTTFSGTLIFAIPGCSPPPTAVISGNAGGTTMTWTSPLGFVGNSAACSDNEAFTIAVTKQ